MTCTPSKSYWQGKKVLVTGGAGFLGTHLCKKLKNLGAKLTIPRSKTHDLRDLRVCEQLVNGQEMVIHLAAKVGGIGLNMTSPGEMYYDNIMMGTLLMEKARIAKIKKFIAMGTICSYPKYSPIPFKEENLWNGYPEETNAPYGLSKKMLLVQADAYRKQYGFNSIHLLPVNMYGPGDNFDPSSSHVIPALIVKFCEAKKLKKPSVTVWGTGKATREFLYVEDAALGVILASQYYDKPQPVNLGASFEISIKDLAHLIANVVGFEGKLIWDKSKPDGQPRRKLDTSYALKEFGFKAKTPFHKGLINTINWYLSRKA